MAKGRKASGWAGVKTAHPQHSQIHLPSFTRPDSELKTLELRCSTFEHSVQQGDDWRGVILPTEIIKVKPLSLAEESSSHISLSELYGYLLFWDRLAAESFENDDQELAFYHFLLGGKKNRKKVTYQMAKWLGGKPLEGNIPKSELRIIEKQAALFHILDFESPGRWAIASRRKDFDVGPFSAEGRSLLVRLYDAVPLPTNDMAVDDILAFKAKRSDELLAFRAHVEALFIKISNSRDISFSFRAEFSALSRSIVDLVHVMEERALRFKFAGLQAKLKWGFDPTSLTTGATVGGFLAGLQGAIAGGAIGLAANLIPKVELEAGAGLISARGDAKGPLQYAFLIREELGRNSN